MTTELERPELNPSAIRLRRWRGFVLVLGMYTVVVVFFALQAHYFFRLRGFEAPWWVCFLRSASRWYSWALLTPLIVWVARRYRFERGLWRRSLLMHLLAAAAICPLQAVLYYGSDIVFEVLADTYPNVTARQMLEWAGSAIPGLAAETPIIYCVVLGIYYTGHYHNRYHERRLRASQLEARLAQAELHILRGQLNPHFLFNSLNAVSCLIREDPDAAERVLALLGDLLRLSFEGAGAQEVPLDQELSFVRRYLEIESVRFSDRLRVMIDVDPCTLDALVPSLILQPLVENAVKHGIAPRSAPGCLSIGARRSDGWLQLRVRDDGVGLRADGAPEKPPGLGLVNTRERLRQLYGDRHRFALVEPPSGGLEVQLDLPFRVKRERASG